LSIINFSWHYLDYTTIDKNINSTRYDCNTNNETLETIFHYNTPFLLNETVKINSGAKLRDFLKFSFNTFFEEDDLIWNAGSNEI